MPGGYKTARGLAQALRLQDAKEEREKKEKKEGVTVDLDAFEKAVKDAASFRKLALKVLTMKVNNFIDEADKYDPGCIEFENWRAGNKGKIASWICESFGIKEREIGQVFRKVRLDHKNDLSNEKVVKFLRAFPSEEKMLEMFEEFRVNNKSF